MVTVEIHEFSTGINAERLPDGGWRSRGFKVGEYMNSTLETIPNSVKRAIANKGFEVSQDRNSQDPTFIGRVVPSTGTVEHDWSVVAAVTPGQDEYGRSTSFYRYFLCEGSDSLWKIIAWMDNQKQSSKPIIFAPFAIQQPGHPHSDDVGPKQKLNLPEDWQAFLSNSPIPVIIQRGQASDLRMINAMAEVKAKVGPVSWAYNVEAIEHPELFTIIQAANEQSYQGLAQRRQYPVNDARAIGLSGDRAAIETAVRGSISGSQIRLEWIQTISAALRENRLTQWEAVFDAMGGTNALRQGSSNPQMVRLLTLRAFVLPETLPEFMSWLRIDEKQKQETPQQKVSLEFQSQLKNKLNQIPDNFTDGIENALDAVLGKKLSVAAVLWLLTAQGSIWAAYRRQMIEDVRTDLIAINNSFSSKKRAPEPQIFRCGESLWSHLCSCWQRTYRSSTYKPLAEFFARLGKSEFAHDLSAYFYQVSDGAVPTDIFKRALPNERSDEGNILGLKVKRKISLPEQGVRFVKKYAIYLAIASLLLSSHGMMYLMGLKQGLKQGQEGVLSNDKIPVNQIALENFTTTNKAIDNLVTELSQLSGKTEQDRDIIISKIRETLVKNTSMQAEDLSYEKATSSGWWGRDWWGEIVAAQEKWVKAIYFYQGNQPNLVADGYIEPDKGTYNLLKCDVADSLGIELQQRPPICPRQVTEAEKEIESFITRTKLSLQTMVKELGEDRDLKSGGVQQDDTTIVIAIKETLPIKGKLDYTAAVRDLKPNEIEILVKAIFSYQQQNGLADDGIIDLNGETYNTLKEEVKAKLLGNP